MSSCTECDVWLAELILELLEGLLLGAAALVGLVVFVALFCTFADWVMGKSR